MSSKPRLIYTLRHTLNRVLTALTCIGFQFRSAIQVTACQRHNATKDSIIYYTYYNTYTTYQTDPCPAELTRGLPLHIDDSFFTNLWKYEFVNARENKLKKNLRMQLKSVRYLVYCAYMHIYLMPYQIPYKICDGPMNDATTRYISIGIYV